MANFAALFRSDGNLSCCLSLPLDSANGSDALSELSETKRFGFLPDGLCSSTWKHVCGNLCSPGAGLPHPIVRFIRAPLYRLADRRCFSFISPAVTINLNHSILRLRRADVKHYLLSGHSAALDLAASPFGLYRPENGPDFDQDVLDEFDDIRAKVAEKMKLRTAVNSCQGPRDITIYLGGTGK